MPVHNSPPGDEAVVRWPRFRGWVKSPTIGSGTLDRYVDGPDGPEFVPGDPYRAKIADRLAVEGDRLEFVIPTFMSGPRAGQPRSRWALCAVDVADGSDLEADSEVDLLADQAELDYGVGDLKPAGRQRLIDLARDNDVAGLEQPRDLIRALGKKLDPDFDPDRHLSNSAPPLAGSFVNDTFTDTSGTALASHTGETGATWTEHTSYGTGDMVISDANRARANVATISCYHASGSPATAEYSVEAPIYVASVAGTMAVAGRIDTAANTLYYVRTTGTAWELNKGVAGSFTLLGSYSQTLSVASTYTATLELLNATKKVYVDSVERISSADNAITAAGKAGLRGGTGTNTTGFHVASLTATDAGGGTQTIAGAGDVASAAAVGQPAVGTGPVTIAGVGDVASAAAVGQPAVVPGAVTIADAGDVASAEAVGAPAVSPGPTTIGGVGDVASTEAVDAPALTTGAVTIAEVGGIASEEAVGAPTLAGGDQPVDPNLPPSIEVKTGVDQPDVFTSGE